MGCLAACAMATGALGALLTFGFDSTTLDVAGVVLMVVGFGAELVLTLLIALR